jgi:hypothetical protein
MFVPRMFPQPSVMQHTILLNQFISYGEKEVLREREKESSRKKK